MKLESSFFHRPCLEVARDLVGKVLVKKAPKGEIKLRITQTEAYIGEEDTACHAHNGKTKRNEVMYMKAGTVYIYLCYGIHLLLNIVTGETDSPEAVLIRACQGYEGPGKLTKKLELSIDLNKSSICENEAFYIEDDGFCCELEAAERIGIDYASPEYRRKPWRFIMKDSTSKPH